MTNQELQRIERATVTTDEHGQILTCYIEDELALVAAFDDTDRQGLEAIVAALLRNL